MKLSQILPRQRTLYDDRSGRLKIVLRHNSMIMKAAALVTPSPNQDRELPLPY
jgi:hypothetical protein